MEEGRLQVKDSVSLSGFPEGAEGFWGRARSVMEQGE